LGRHHCDAAGFPGSSGRHNENVPKRHSRDHPLDISAIAEQWFAVDVPKIEAHWTLTVFTSTQAGICSDELFEDTAIGGHSCVSIPGGDGGNDSVKFDAGGQYQIEFYEDGQCEEFVRLLGPTNSGNCEELNKKVGSYVLYHVGVETEGDFLGRSRRR
jgi:hypothetical protein